jgi:hypothetical protein
MQEGNKMVVMLSVAMILSEVEKIKLSKNLHVIYG